jgi:MFS family permease
MHRNILEGLGFFVPNIYLPTYAAQLGASSSISALTIIIFNIASVFGCIAMGNLVDRCHVTTCILISTIGSTLSVFLLWGFSTSIAPLLCFCFAYGLTAGSFSSTWPGIMVRLKREERSTDGSMVFAALSAGRGIGNVLSGPVSEALVRAGEVGKEGLYATEYGPLVLFTGVSAALGSVGFFGRRLGWV